MTNENYSALSYLPADVIRTSIAPHLEKKDRAVLGALSFGLFRALYGNLLTLVTNGSELSVSLLLTREKPSDTLESKVLKKGNVTDPGGRTFENISPLQYAYWMGDWYMVDMLLSHLSLEQLAEALRQINEVKRHDVEGKLDLENQKGIKYQLYVDVNTSVEEKDFTVQHLAPVILFQENVTYEFSFPPAEYDYARLMPFPEIKGRVSVIVKGEQHYDYRPLIKTLKDYLPIYQQWEESGFSDNNLKKKVIKHWRKIVGLVQRYATAFLAQQYCHTARFRESVKFHKREFKNRSLDLYNFFTHRYTSWFCRESGLGISFGILQEGFHGFCEQGAVGREMVDSAIKSCHSKILHDIVVVERLSEASAEEMLSVLSKHFSVTIPAMQSEKKCTIF